MSARGRPVFDADPVEQMNGAVRLGLFAGDAALALDRTIACRRVDEADRTVLTNGLELLESLRGSAEPAGGLGGPSQLAVGEAGLDIFKVMEEEAAEASIGQFLAPLVEGLNSTLAHGPGDHLEELKTLLRVFVAIGDAEVERVSCLSQPRSPSIPV